MRRNPFGAEQREMQRQARLQIQRAAPAPGVVSEASGATVGGNDPTTGEWVPYGLVNITPLEAPFRVAPGGKGG